MPRELPTVIISVHGGLVQDVFCSDPDTRVALVDWDQNVTALAIPASLNPMARRWQSLSTHWPASIHFRARMWNGHWNQLTCMASFKYLWRSTLRVSRRWGPRPELGYPTRYMLHVHKVIAAKTVDQTGLLKHGEVHRVAMSQRSGSLP